MAHRLLGRTGSFLALFAAVSLTGGCKELFESGVDDGFKDTISGKGVGEDCGKTSECRDGLVCESDGTNDVCTFAADTLVGKPCIYTEQCAPGLYCDHTRSCQAAGTVAPGGECTTSDDCARGAQCTLSGLSAQCVEAGDADLGEACSVTSDCFAGLTCAAASMGTTCTTADPTGMPGDPAPPPFPLWMGEECGADDTQPTAYFEVPRGGAELPDFYRLPFPNNIRMTDGHIDMTGHPEPPTVLNVPIIKDYLEAVETLDGFSTNPVMFFRFSEAYDWQNVRGNILIVDITDGSPTYGQTVPLHWLTTSGQLSKYICRNWIAFAPGVGTTLRAATTYAAIIKTSVRTNDNQTFGRSTDLNALLGSNAPGNADLAAAHAKYAPLRAWLADSANGEVAADEVLNAAVFTTQDPEAVLPPLREAVRADDMPTVSDVTVCESTTTVSPCADGGEQRVCSAPNARFTEIHGRISLPIFQHGTAPYESEGGGIELDGSGAPTIARHEEVCFALTVPKTAIPTEGFPLMLYAHGTGGSFTNAVGNGLAEDVADDTAAAATLTIDLPQHGARRGDSTRDSDELFFNFLNPDAARDNVLQGSADLLSLVRWASTYSQDANATGGEIRFNPARIALFAHSQGATHASLMFPYEPDLDAILLSGNGGHLTTSLLTKENPINIKAALPFAMLDPDPNNNAELAGGVFHPMLALFQTYFDRVDPLNFARRVHTAPSDLAPEGHHVFMTYGENDTYSSSSVRLPPPNDVTGVMEHYARAAALPQVVPVLTELSLIEHDAPLSANVPFASVDRTIGLRQYDPSSGEDGHFVSTDTGYSDVLNFVRQALSGVTPAIGE